MLSQRALKMTPSTVMSLGAKAQQKKAQGVDVISLALGEPTWDTPKSICSAGIRAIQEGHTKYTPASGSQKLRESIASNTEKWLGLAVHPSEVTVSIGAKFVLFSAIQSLCDPGDEVLVPAPYWVSYPAMVELSGATLVSMHTSRKHSFKLQAEVLKQHLNSRTKLLILNSPNNPSGSVFTRDELKSLGEVLKKYPGVYILSDDIYNHLYFSGSMAPHLLQTCPELKDRVLCVNAVSKNYSMPGWRIGWAVGNKKVINAMSDFQSQTVSCASSISQEAAAWALTNCDKELEETRKHLMKTKYLAIEHFQSIKGLDVFPPQGAFYLWIGVKELFGLSVKGKNTIQSSIHFTEELFESQSVLCVPGEAFGYPGYVRIHFAVEEKRLLTACTRIKDFISSLK